MARDRGPIKIMTNALLQMEDIKLLQGDYLMERY